MKHYFICSKRISIGCICPSCGKEFNLFSGKRVVVDGLGKVVVCKDCQIDGEKLFSIIKNSNLELKEMSSPTEEDVKMYRQLNSVI